MLVRSYVQTYGLDARVTRCCNNYGPNQYPEKFIPLAIKNLKEGKKISVYGDGMNIREWIHVEDHCSGIQTVINFGSKGEIYNIGSGEELSNLELAQLLLKNNPTQDSGISFVQDRKGHDLRYSVDSTKIKKLGFVISQGLKESLPKLW